MNKPGLRLHPDGAGLQGISNVRTEYNNFIEAIDHSLKLNIFVQSQRGTAVKKILLTSSVYE
jgi:hypothetical protein